MLRKQIVSPPSPEPIPLSGVIQIADVSIRSTTLSIRAGDEPLAVLAESGPSFLCVLCAFNSSRLIRLAEGSASHIQAARAI